MCSATAQSFASIIIIVIAVCKTFGCRNRSPLNDAEVSSGGLMYIVLSGLSESPIAGGGVCLLVKRGSDVSRIDFWGGIFLTVSCLSFQGSVR